MILSQNRLRIKQLFLLCLVFMNAHIFAVPPVQGASLHGAGAVNARLALIGAAESFLGTPYRYAGISKSGIDCSGLIYMSFRESLNVAVPRRTDNIYNWTEKIATSDLQPGDLVFFITAGNRVSHVGIYAGGGRFIHSASEGPSTGVIYSRLDESYWKRTYHGAGRAIPWDEEAAKVMAKTMPTAAASSYTASSPKPVASSTAPAKRLPSAPAAKIASASSWDNPGVFAGFGAAWTWGGIAAGSNSVFRGFSAMGTIGYKWTKFRLGLELRPELDRALDVFRLPVTLSMGTKYFQIFGGPAITIGEPKLKFSTGERSYSGGSEWSGELGLSFSLPFNVSKGSLAVYGETSWQHYRRGEGTEFSLSSDFAANFRFSTGVRYFFPL